MVFIFFYLVLLVFHKWVAYDAKGDADGSGPHCAPSILIIFINMVLFKSGEKIGECEPYMYSGQEGFQKFLVVIAVFCVPWMLFGKPYLIYKHRQLQHQQFTNVNSAGITEEGGADLTQIANGGAPPSGEHDDNEKMEDIAIHQAIHTIEYVLGCVSNTASYLRLWALSLAHAQLSEVLWGMVLRNGLQSSSWFGGIVLFMIFAAWASLTLAILVLMEGLSAFLHTLRLHWVEFQNKFYQGAGYPFMPFSFEAIIESAQNVEE